MNDRSIDTYRVTVPETLMVDGYLSSVAVHAASADEAREKAWAGSARSDAPEHRWPPDVAKADLKVTPAVIGGASTGEPD